MTKRILILFASATIVAAAQVGAIDPNRPHSEHEQEKGKKPRYTCPMHPEIVRAEPGECPKCGMTLVALEENRKRPTSNAQRPTLNSEHATHNANGMAMPQHTGHEHEMKMSMQSSINIADPMNRESSGTAWVPDSTPMYGYMKMFGDDMLMLHGGIFPRYTNVSSHRGDDRI